MNETEPVMGAVTAGALLRAERERLGLRLDVLATTLKVGVHKLEALEADRHDELPDPAFTRALAMSLCRVMGIDAAPVLALLPRATGSPEALEHVTVGLQAPFDARAAQGWVGRTVPAWRSPARMAAALVLGAGLIAVLLWISWRPQQAGARAPAPASAAAAAAASAAVPATVSGSLQSVPLPSASSPSASASPVAAADPLSASPGAPAASNRPGDQVLPGPSAASSIRVTAPTWVELRDGSGRLLWARTLDAGEAASLDGPLPLRLVVGNASAASLNFNGRPVDLRPWTRDNMARVEIK